MPRRVTICGAPVRLGVMIRHGGSALRPLAVKRLTVYPLALTMRRQVTHARSQRAVSEPIVVAVELIDGTLGYGETLPRPYVTGETNQTVVDLLDDEFTAQLLAMRPSSFFEAVEAIDALPLLTRDGIGCPAARSCVELALLDAYLRSTGRTVADVVGWMGLPAFGPPGSRRHARYSAVLASESLNSLLRTVRLAYWLGMRHFKLKVGFADDGDRLALVLKRIAPAVRRDRASLRLDANGAWTVGRAVEVLGRFGTELIAGLEQPLPRGSEDQLGQLRAVTGVRVIHDESLITMDDAERLHGLGVADVFNIRISKCGGLMPALRLAGYARARGIDVQLGCMVGETSILSAAGIRFLENVPGVRYCEGSFGNLLMSDDVVRRSIRFKLGGRVPRIASDGLGAAVEPALLERHCLDRPKIIEL